MSVFVSLDSWSADLKGLRSRGRSGPVSWLGHQQPSLALGGGKMRDPGNEVGSPADKSKTKQIPIITMVTSSVYVHSLYHLR